MDVREMAHKYLDEVHDERIDYREDIFIAGYNAAYEWFPMETCLKDGNKVLIAEDKGDYGIQVFCASWDQSNFATKKMDWCVDEAYYDEGNITIYNPVAWMPLPKYTHKP